MSPPVPPMIQQHIEHVINGVTFLSVITAIYIGSIVTKTKKLPGKRSIIIQALFEGTIFVLQLTNCLIYNAGPFDFLWKIHALTVYGIWIGIGVRFAIYRYYRKPSDQTKPLSNDLRS